MARSGPLPEFADLVRAADRPRYFAALFAPAAVRADLLAVAALRAELAAVADRVSESGLGEIRLTWWRDSLESVAAGGAAETPLLRALGAAIGRHRLPAAPLLAMAEAFRGDLYSDPAPTINDLEGFLGETESAVFQLSALILGSDAGASAEAAGHAGVAYGIARRLAALARERRRGRAMVPADVLHRHGLPPEGLFAGADGEALAAAVGDLAAHARTHHARALAALKGAGGRAARAAFLPLAAVPPLLAAVGRAGAAILHRTADTGDATLILRMARRAFF